jgi:tRNA pseudouridine55 synthase
MARRRKGSPVSGWLILDKPQGMTSTQAVTKIRRLFDAAKAGHAGTLDPLATGVLPIALGEATKTVPFAVEGLKTYRFTVRFGTETDTEDAEGMVVATSDARPSIEAIEAMLPRFTGEISQVPPRFSALKVEGARAYDLARDKKNFELTPRMISIERLSPISCPDPDHCVLEAECGRGTYIRALARDLGRALGTCAHVEALRRTCVGSFGERDAVTLAELETLKESAPEADALESALKPVQTALSEIPALALSFSDAARLRQGQSVLLRGRDAPVFTGTAYATLRGTLIALGEMEKGEFRPKRIFNLPG